MKRATSDKANSYFLSGHEVLFPLDRTPFPSQKVMMSMMLNCLQKRKNGLLGTELIHLVLIMQLFNEFTCLESPTGTGKTLAVLTASLAFQKQDYAIAEATFNEEMTKYQEELKVLGLDKTVNAAVHMKLPQKAKKKKIIFASRTHSQLQQSVKELDIIRDEYTQGLIVGLLGSRKQFCVNETVLMNRQNLDEQCLELKKVRGCKYNYYLDPLVKYMQANPVLDIEDIQSKGLKYKSCPYYASKKIAMSPNTDLLFVPYNYVLDPAIRKSSVIDLKDSIIIFDEAHNIEDVCRDVASCEMEFTSLEIAKKQLSKLSEHGSTAFGVFLKLISELKDWCDEMHRLLLGSVVGDSGDGLWTGSEILEIYKERFGLSVDTLAIYESSLNTISEEQEDAAGIVNDTTDPMMQPYSDHIDLAYENEDNNENMNPTLAMNKNPHVLSAPILMMLKNLVLTHSLIHSLIHLLTHLLTHSRTYSLTHSRTHSLTYSLTHIGFNF